LEPVTDRELLDRLCSRDSRAFELLYQRYKVALVRFCLGILKDQHRAEDAVHETFLKLFRRSDTLEDRTSCRAWLFRVARNECLMVIRRERHSALVDGQDVWDEDTPLTILVGLQTQESISKALDALKVEYREVILLRESERLSYAAIAAITDSTESAVKSRLFKARRALASALAPLLEERIKE
jgi:RNA polymerase sigma-70 factor, ECF subfamily